MTGEMGIAVGATFAVLWAVFSLLSILADEDWVEAIVRGFILTMLLAFIAAVALGLVAVWMWAL